VTTAVTAVVTVVRGTWDSCYSSIQTK
jgi:hypothetical protein